MEHSRRARTWGAALEIAAIFSAILLFIWRLRFSWPLAWIPVLALIVASSLLRRESARDLGLTSLGLASAARVAGPGLLALALAAIAIAGWAGAMRQVALLPALLGLAAYCVWGLVQQYIVNGFFLNRLREIAARPHVAPVAAAALFSLLHLPNPLLMALTFAGGWIAAEFYLRYRNLWVLAIAHGVLGSLVFLVFPDRISHHLHVGPGYISYCNHLCGGAHLWLASL